MRQAVLLLAHGAPERLEDIEPYILRVREGRPLAPALLEEIRSRYALIPGCSPLLARTRAQAAALGARLAAATPVPVYIGMRNWHPFIRDTLASMREAGVERIVAICLAPQYSRASTGLYRRKTEEALAELGYAPQVVWTGSLHDHPLLIEAFHERLAPLLGGRKVLFTAHSLPEKILRDGDPYERETKTTARLVAERSGIAEWDFAYQSQGLTDDVWLGPTVESMLDAYAREGITETVLAPIGFVADHVEILYDVDILFRGYARKLGIELFRPESLNDSPSFIAALADVAERTLRSA